MARGHFYTTEQLSRRQSLTPEGFLLCEEVPIARTGMMIYGPGETPLSPGPDGVVKIYRDDEEVFRPETIASANGKPITNDHPDNDVTPNSWRELVQGMALNIRRGKGAMDDLLLADFIITTPEGIESVKSGKREVSLGYDADYEELKPGVGKQSNIIINHIALVENGRCGSRCAIGDKLLEEADMAKKKSIKIKDLLRKAYKAKDQAELEALEDEVCDQLVEIKDEELPEVAEGSDTHLHIHHDMKGDESIGRSTFTDDDIQEFITKNDTEHQDMFDRIGRLEESIGKLLQHEEEEHYVDEMSGEMPDEPRETFAKAQDSGFMQGVFQNTVAMAEILAPGIKFPTFDSTKRPKKTYKSICKLRRKAIDAAYINPMTKPLIKSLLGGQPLDTKRMSCGAIRTLFNSASSLKQEQNNAGRANALDIKRTAAAGEKKITSLADLNKLNKEKYRA